MKLFLLVSVIQNGRNIVKEAANSIDDNGTFADLLKEVLNSANLPDMNVMVDFQCINSPIWHVISKGIEEDLAMCQPLKIHHIRFIYSSQFNNQSDNRQDTTNPFTIMMENSKKIQLPAARGNTNNINKLYNHLLDILRSKDLGWHIASTSNIGKSFVDRLTNLLWYIDPHHAKLRSRGCIMPNFVQNLPEYMANSKYNTFYDSSHHKKEDLKRNILENHINSVKNSISQPWTRDEQ